MNSNPELEKMFFRPVCSWEEIERIFNVKNANDYLLKLRAETIVDNMRLFRVYRNKALPNENTWTLEASFASEHYDRFINNLPPKQSEACRHVIYGNIFSTDPNGTIFFSKYGPIITICDSLRFFFKFAHLALLSFKSEVPGYVRLNALRIAIRVMLATETLDFLMDPRGIIPEDVGYAIHNPIPFQLQFIAGHEFAHYYLEHLDKSRISKKPLFFAISEHDSEYKPLPVYTKSQSQELEADVSAILTPHYTLRGRRAILEAALLWFGSLELYEAICDFMCPTNPWDPKTHPPARDRFNNLLDHCARSTKLHIDRWNKFLETIERWKDILMEDISADDEKYQFYGSLYLDKPDSEWRGPRLIDRVDYY